MQLTALVFVYRTIGSVLESRLHSTGLQEVFGRLSKAQLLLFISVTFVTTYPEFPDNWRGSLFGDPSHAFVMSSDYHILKRGLWV